MIGVMASAVLPGRIGEPTRVLVLTRRLDGPTGALLPVVAGTVFSQTLINLLALAILAAVTFTSVPLLHGHARGRRRRRSRCRWRSARSCSSARACWRSARRSRSPRVARAARHGRARCCDLARRGLVVFARPRYGAAAVAAQLLAWALQWLACYVVAARARAAAARQASRPPPRSCWPSTSARSCPRRRRTSASSRPPAWSCSPPTASAPARASPTASSCRRSRSLTALALGDPGAARRGPQLAATSALGRQRRRTTPAPTRTPTCAQPASARSDWRSERVVCSTAVGS